MKYAKWLAACGCGWTGTLFFALAPPVFGFLCRAPDFLLLFALLEGLSDRSRLPFVAIGSDLLRPEVTDRVT